MAVVGVIEVDLRAKIAGFQAAMTRVGTTTKKTAKVVAKSSLAIGKSMARIGLAIAPIGALMVKVGAQFEQEMANVKAISGATSDEFEILRQSAERLGATTKFTATQVAQLQTEFSKLGFTASEIVKVQKGTLDLASAIGADLATAAEVAGSTLRGFNLDASETNRVTDVMAKSFSSSALDIEKFRESMKFIAPVANAAGFSIEQTTALMAKMADAGISGSLAGTGLKRILSQLNDESSDLNKLFGGSVKTFDQLVPALIKLKEGNFDLAAATEFLDERSKAAFLTLVNGSDVLKEYKKSLDDATGSAKKMAEIQLDTLHGRLLKLKSAWEGLSINALQSQGVLSKVTDHLADTIAQYSTILFGANTGTLVKQYDEVTKRLAKLDDLVSEFSGKTTPELIKAFKDLGLVYDENADRSINFRSLILAEEKALNDLTEQRKKDKAALEGQGDEEENLLRAKKLTVEELKKLFSVRSQFNFKPIKLIEDKEADKVMELQEAMNNLNLVFKSFVDGTLGQLKEEFPEIFNTVLESATVVFDAVSTLADSLANTVSQFADIERAKVQKNEKDKTKAANKSANDRIDAVQKQVEAGVISEDQGAQRITAINAQRETAITAIEDQAATDRANIRKKEKPFLIAAAIANTALGVAKALGQGGVFGLITGALVAAAGAAQVATIQAQQFQTGGVIPGTGTGDKVPILAEPKEFMLNKATTNRIGVENLENLNAGGSIGAGDVFEITIVTLTPSTWEQFLKGEGRDGFVRTVQDIFKRGP